MARSLRKEESLYLLDLCLLLQRVFIIEQEVLMGSKCRGSLNTSLTEKWNAEARVVVYTINERRPLLVMRTRIETEY